MKLIKCQQRIRRNRAGYPQDWHSAPHLARSSGQRRGRMQDRQAFQYARNPYPTIGTSSLLSIFINLEPTLYRMMLCGLSQGR